MRRVSIISVLTAVFTFVTHGCGCSEKNAAEEWQDASIHQDAEQPDSMPPEAGPRPDARIFECIDARPGSETVLPVKKSTYYMAGMDVEFPYWVYAELSLVDGKYESDIMLMDLTTFEIRQLTDTPWSEGWPRMNGDEIIWNDMRFYSYEYRQVDFYLHTISTGETVRLTETSWYNAPNSLTSTHILYRTMENVPEDSSGFNLVLWERGTQNKIVLATHDQNWGRAGIIGDRYVIWSGYMDGLDPPARPIHYYNIQTGEQRQVEGTLTSYQLHLDGSGTRLVWQDWRNNNYWNSDIFTYDISTGEERAVTDYPKDQCFPAIRDHLVIWKDYRRRPTLCDSGFKEGDMVIHDLNTGVTRAITSCPVLYTSIFVSSRYVIRLEPIEGETEEWRYTLVDLVKAGILDSNLNVIPDLDSEWEEYQ